MKTIKPMTNRRTFLTLSGLGIAAVALRAAASEPVPISAGKPTGDKVVKTDAEWKKTLTPQQYEVLRGHGTERPFGAGYWNSHEKAIYVCAGCDQELFDSETKFDSGTGWPSFFAAADRKNVVEHTDTSHGMKRVEARCARCDAHLGHVFPDGPEPSGLRYCMNSASLDFKPKQ